MNAALLKALLRPVIRRQRRLVLWLRLVVVWLAGAGILLAGTALGGRSVAAAVPGAVAIVLLAGLVLTFAHTMGEFGVVLGADLFGVAPEDVHSVPVVLTMMDGRVTFDGR